MVRKARQGALPLVSDLSDESFGSFLHNLAKKPKSGVDGIADLTRQQLTSVCGTLEQHVRAAISAASEAPDGAGQPDAQADNNFEDILATLYGAALLSLELLAKSQQSPPEELLAAASMLHDEVLMGLMESEVGTMQLDLQDAIMRLCCTWWERKLPGNELLVARTIPYVLLRAVESLDRGRTSLVHNCYVIRDALELLDYDDETIKDTKKLLLWTAMHPAFLREPEGRRFIAGLFKLEQQMTRELAAVVRNQIPSGQRFALEAYGEILFRAWRDTIGPCAAEVEAEVQGLMQAAILASTPALAAALRTVLNGFHSHKTVERRLNPALVRLYDPILPRAFSSANAEVRRNATNLLVAAFPILDPEAPVAENNLRLTQQMGLLTDGLADPSHVVREAAVEGCCHCLKCFWEIIPAANSAKMISDLTSKLAYDEAHRAVRVAVLRGLCGLIDCPHALPVLKKALPNVSGLLHDKHPAVREAMADLLIAVSSCRSLQVAAVVPIDELLEKMGEESVPAVARKISRILGPSYVPNAEEGSARLGSLLRAKPDAGLAFCRNMVARFCPGGSSRDTGRSSAGAAPEFTAQVPAEHILRLAADLAAHLLAAAPAPHPAGRTPPAKRPKARRGDKAARSNTAAGRKRAKKKDAVALQELDEEEEAEQEADPQGAGDVGADNGEPNGAAPQNGDKEEEDDDVVLENAGPETEQAWAAILEGLAVVVHGLNAAVTVAEECSVGQLEDVLPGETLTQLLQIAERIRKPRAVKDVLQMAAAVWYLPGAQQMRNLLFGRLVEGTLPGLGGGASEEAMELDGHRGPSGQDVELLAEILKTLTSGENGPKLVAILSAALGVRQALPVRKPVEKKKSASRATSKRGHGRGGGHRGGDGRDDRDQDPAVSALQMAGLDLSGHAHIHSGDGEDDILCFGCRRAQPADTMLICDGCDNACHIDCLRPPLEEVPETAWFCWNCETQLQSVQLPAAAAARCLSLMLQLDGPREMLCGHSDFSATIQAMHELAMLEAEEIVRVAQAGAAGEQGEEADSAPAHPGTASGPDVSLQLLDDPWGSLARYLRAALHRALWATRPQDGDADGEGAAAAAAPTPARTPASAGRRRRGRRASLAVAGEEARGAGSSGEEGAEEGDPTLTGFYEIVSVIDWAVQTCVQLAEMVMEHPCLAGHLAALRFSHGMLRVLYVVQQTDILNLNAAYVAQISYLCTVQAALAQAAATLLAAEGGGSKQQQAIVGSTIQAVLALTQQMVVAVRTGAAEGGAAGEGEGAEGGALGLGGSSAGLAAATPAPARAAPGVRGIGGRGGACGGKSADEQQGDDGGSAGGLEASEESEDELPSQQLEARMDAAAGSGSLGRGRRQSKGAGGEEGLPAAPPTGVSVERLAVGLMTLLCDAAVGGLLKGAVRITAADLVGELLTATRRADADGWLGTLSRLTGEVLIADARVTSELDSILSGRNADADNGGEGEDKAADAAAAEGDAAAAAGAVRGVRRRPRAGAKKGAAAAGAADKAQAAVASRLQELLQQENPAVATMADVLVRVCAARKAHGHAMLLLARLAAGAVAIQLKADRPLDAAANPSTDGQAAGEAAAAEPGENADAGGEPDEGVSALGAVVLLAICRASAPAADDGAGAPAKQQRLPAAGGRRGRGGGRCGSLAQEAAAQAARAEAEAAAKALGVLRRALDEGRVLQPMQPGQVQQELGSAAENVAAAAEEERVAHVQGAAAVKGLARSVVQALLGGGDAAGGL